MTLPSIEQQRTSASATRRFAPYLTPQESLAVKTLGTKEVYVEALCADGKKAVEKIESEVAFLWPVVYKDVAVNKKGKTADNPVQLPKQVGHDVLNLLLEYCRYHKFPGRSDKERKIFDEKFIRLDTRRLCELTSAADSLDMKPLVDLSSRALARMIEGKTPEEIRETFHLPDDLTEEEKLEPVKNIADDPRIRLLNRLYAKKRKELADKKAELVRMEAGVGPSTPVNQDPRSVEDLMRFIQEGGEQGKQMNTARSKKKKPKKRKEALPLDKDVESHALQSNESGLSTAPSDPGTSQISVDEQSTVEEQVEEQSIEKDASGHLTEQFANAALDWLEGQDAGKDYDAELDSEILAFERSLNADWEERRAELMLKAGGFDSQSTEKLNLDLLPQLLFQPSSRQRGTSQKSSNSHDSKQGRENSLKGAEPEFLNGSTLRQEPQVHSSHSDKASHRRQKGSRSSEESKDLSRHKGYSAEPIGSDQPSSSACLEGHPPQLDLQHDRGTNGALSGPEDLNDSQESSPATDKPDDSVLRNESSPRDTTSEALGKTTTRAEQGGRERQEHDDEGWQLCSPDEYREARNRVNPADRGSALAPENNEQVPSNSDLTAKDPVVGGNMSESVADIELSSSSALGIHSLVDILRQFVRELGLEHAIEIAASQETVLERSVHGGDVKVEGQVQGVGDLSLHCNRRNQSGRN